METPHSDGICKGRFVLRCRSSVDGVTNTVECGPLASGLGQKETSLGIRESVWGFIRPSACCGQTSFASNVVLEHQFTCHFRHCRHSLFNTREGALPNRSNVFGDFLVGRLPLFTAANSDHCEVVLHPSRSAPVAPPAASSSWHTSNNKCAWPLSWPFEYLPEPTSKLSTVLIPEVRACLSPASSDCSSRTKCRRQRFRLAALTRLDRVGG